MIARNFLNNVPNSRTIKKNVEYYPIEKHNFLIVDDKFNSEVILWEDRQ